MILIERWIGAAAATLAVAGFAVPLHAQDAYPGKTVRLSAPFPPAGSTDTQAANSHGLVLHRAQKVYLIDLPNRAV